MESFTRKNEIERLLNTVVLFALFLKTTSCSFLYVFMSQVNNLTNNDSLSSHLNASRFLVEDWHQNLEAEVVIITTG